ncbi:SOS response-associated peptidase [Parasalinivibrio latis]|uniref:SOS response-associated peptidase n=1 Tax=Parasalinivibrio latis TaxID=2952610 RepID=UPI0030E04EE7
MCGRINVSDDPLAQFITDALGIPFHTKTNTDLRPTDPIDVIRCSANQPEQLALNWGYKPHWAKKPLINAQAETVSVKPTFKNAFYHHRCIVPCTGWYEWKADDTGKKQKYLFSDPDNGVVWMAGIFLEGRYLVTLTTKPNGQCEYYHHRMPLLIKQDHLTSWLSPNVESAGALLSMEYEGKLHISGN